jgi:hypothetical protein
MLNIPTFAGHTSSLWGFARLAANLLSKFKQVPLYDRVPAFNRFLSLGVSTQFPSAMGKWRMIPTEPLMGGRRKYNRVLPGVLRGSLVILLSPPQCHAGLSIDAWNLALSVPLPLLAAQRHYPPSRQGRQGLVFGGVVAQKVVPDIFSLGK